MRRRTVGCLFAILVVTASIPSNTFAADWPQWLGPRRDSIWREDGMIQRIPEGGLDVKWRVPVGWGYAGPAVSNGRVYLMDYIHKSGTVTNSSGSRDRLDGVERILCLDAASGAVHWKHEYQRTYNISYPKGPRCTPTVADGKVYALGAEGDLHCLNAQSGMVVWKKDFVSEYKAKTPQWGFTNHPLVDDRWVYCVVGGTGSVVVAFDKDTGEEAWRALSASEPGYCPPTMIEHGGDKQLIIWHKESINSLNPGTGEVRWSSDLAPRFGLATAAPRLVGDHLFASGAGVSALLDASTGNIVWTGSPTTSVACTMSTPIIDDGVIYGNDGSGTVIAAKVEDGGRLWEMAKPIAARPQRSGTVFLVKNGDRYFLFNDSGDLILATLSKAGYTELGRFRVLDATNHTGSREVLWSHPAFAERSLFARNDKELVCVSLAAK